MFVRANSRSLHRIASANGVHGRREINWDGIPDLDFPFDFFNRVSPRGLVLSSADRAVKGFRAYRASALSSRTSRYRSPPVRVSPGTAILGEEDIPAAGRNLAAMDDFVFGEPRDR